MIDNGEIAPFSEEEVDNIDPSDLLEELDSISEEGRKIIVKWMISSYQMRESISPENVISKKLTEDHITQYLDSARENMNQNYAEKKQSKIFFFLTFLVALAFIVIIVALLKDTPDVMEKVIYALGGLVAGAFGGYGLGRKKDDN